MAVGRGLVWEGPQTVQLETGSLESLTLLFCLPPASSPVPSLSPAADRLPPGEHAYKCSWCAFSTMTISQLKEHSLKVHGKALTLPRPRIVSLLSSHAHHSSSQKATPAEEVEDSNGKTGLLSRHQSWVGGGGLGL